MKHEEYFAAARKDYIDALPVNPNAKILEVGCGYGNTGALALSACKCGLYCGVEICEDAARKAKERISEIVIGNVEKISLPWPKGFFDALIMSEVLEHLIEPEVTLKRLRPLMAKGALVLASSPNVSHWAVISMLLRGEWSLSKEGTMDAAHLRWFTPKTYRELFESCGYGVDSVEPLPPLKQKDRIKIALMLGHGAHLFTRQINLRAHCG